MGKRTVIMHETYDETLEPPAEERRRKSKKIEKLERRREKFAEEKKWSFDLKPKTENQRLALQYFASKPMVVLEGSAGSGKSTLASAWACKKLVEGKYDRFVVTRNAIGIGKSVGFFPGTATDKCAVWMANVLGMCRGFVGKGTVDLWMKGESPKLLLEPTEVLRGQSFERTIVLVEEAQQLSIEVDNGNYEVIVSYANGKYNFIGGNADEYPRVKALEENYRSFDINAQALLNGIQVRELPAAAPTAKPTVIFVH